MTDNFHKALKKFYELPNMKEFPNNFVLSWTIIFSSLLLCRVMMEVQIQTKKIIFQIWKFEILKSLQHFCDDILRIYDIHLCVHMILLSIA